MDYKVAIVKAQEQVKEISAAILRDVSVGGLGVAVDATPVLSGLLVGNWKLTRNQMNTEVDTGIGPVRSGAKQRAEVAGREVKLGDVVFVTNPVPYSGFVNYGTSKIAPRLMAELAIASLPRLFEEAARKNRS